MARGTVKWFSDKKGFGFIVDPEIPEDIFVHYSEIQTSGFRTLSEGEEVEYELYLDDKGAKARKVVRITQMQMQRNQITQPSSSSSSSP